MSLRRYCPRHDDGAPVPCTCSDPDTIWDRIAKAFLIFAIVAVLANALRTWCAL